jgi:integrase
MTVPVVLDSAGRRRSPATMSGYHAGRPPRNKGQLYPADPPTVEEIVAVMRLTGERSHGWRLRAMIVVLWRGGLRIQEALALAEHDLDPRRGSLLVRNGKGGKRREVGMDEWGWEQLRPWLSGRAELPVGRLFCVIDGPTRGRPWSSAGVRKELRRLAARAQASDVASRRISCATHTRSSSPARASRSTSSSANSGTPTSARPRSTCKASTPRRSSAPSARDAPR